MILYFQENYSKILVIWQIWNAFASLFLVLILRVYVPRESLRPDVNQRHPEYALETLRMHSNGYLLKPPTPK